VSLTGRASRGGYRRPAGNTRGNVWARSASSGLRNDGQQAGVTFDPSRKPGAHGNAVQAAGNMVTQRIAGLRRMVATGTGPTAKIGP